MDYMTLKEASEKWIRLGVIRLARGISSRVSALMASSSISRCPLVGGAFFSHVV